MTLRLLFALSALLFYGSALFAEPETLYVFYPSSHRPYIIQEKLKKSLDDVKILVFGHYSDFAARIKVAPPTAILSKTSIISGFANYAIALQGMNGKDSKEHFVLMTNDSSSLEKPLTHETTIGVVNYLHRDAMFEFVSKILGLRPKIKRVTKYEDLLPLMIFDMAEYVLLEQKNAEYLSGLSNSSLYTMPIGNKRYGIVSVAVNTENDSCSIVTSLKKSESETGFLFGIDSWK